MLKPNKNDIKAEIKFEPDELDLLQDNTYQMAESFGLDSRIGKLTGKRKVGFYSWDLDCLECVVDNLKTDKDYEMDRELIDRLYEKIVGAMLYIDSFRGGIK